jgi:hypothetical protein
VDLIATRRPFDDPGVKRSFYRFVPLKEALVAKTHMPYRLDQARMSLWQRLFVDPPFSVKSPPSYRFGVRRTSRKFWPLSDEAHLAMKEHDGVNFGLLDYSRLENR